MKVEPGAVFRRLVSTGKSKHEQALSTLKERFVKLKGMDVGMKKEEYQKDVFQDFVSRELFNSYDETITSREAHINLGASRLPKLLKFIETNVKQREKKGEFIEIALKAVFEELAESIDYDRVAGEGVKEERYNQYKEGLNAIFSNLKKYENYQRADIMNKALETFQKFEIKCEAVGGFEPIKVELEEYISENLLQSKKESISSVPGCLSMHRPWTENSKAELSVERNTRNTKLKTIYQEYVLAKSVSPVQEGLKEKEIFDLVMDSFQTIESEEKKAEKQQQLVADFMDICTQDHGTLPFVFKMLSGVTYDGVEDAVIASFNTLLERDSSHGAQIESDLQEFWDNYEKNREEYKNQQAKLILLKKN